MKKELWINLILLLMIIFLVGYSIIKLEQKNFINFTLPEYDHIDDFDFSDDQYMMYIEVQEVTFDYGIKVQGETKILVEESRIKTFTVPSTKHKIGDLIQSGDIIDGTDNLTADFIGQVFNITTFNEQTSIQIYNFSNVYVNTYVSSSLFQKIDFNKDIYLENNQNKYNLEVFNIGHQITDFGVNIDLQFISNHKFNNILYESMILDIYFIEGQITAKTLPISYLSLINAPVRVLRGSQIFTTYLNVGHVGFDYFEILNHDIQIGDKIIYG